MPHDAQDAGFFGGLLGPKCALPTAQSICCGQYLCLHGCYKLFARISSAFEASKLPLSYWISSLYVKNVATEAAKKRTLCARTLQLSAKRSIRSPLIILSIISTIGTLFWVFQWGTASVARPEIVANISNMLLKTYPDSGCPTFLG